LLGIFACGSGFVTELLSPEPSASSGTPDMTRQSLLGPCGAGLWEAGGAARSYENSVLALALKQLVLTAKEVDWRCDPWLILSFAFGDVLNRRRPEHGACRR